MLPCPADGKIRFLTVWFSNAPNRTETIFQPKRNRNNHALNAGLV
jgi:hypothetical protein